MDEISKKSFSQIAKSLTAVLLQTTVFICFYFKFLKTSLNNLGLVKIVTLTFTMYI